MKLQIRSGKTTNALDIFEEGNHVEEELLSQFGFASHHEALQLRPLLTNQLQNSVLCQAHSVAKVHGPDVVQFAFSQQLLQDLMRKHRVKD